MSLLANMTKKARIIVGVSAVILILLVFLLTLYLQTLPPGKGDKEIVLDIPMGTSTVNIVNKLAQEGVIKNKTLYKAYLYLGGHINQLQAGNYELTDGVNYSELTEILSSGQVNKESVRFTIPEGFKVIQIAERLENQGIADKEVFLDIVENGDFDYWFINQIPKDVDYRLEGYLFPNTYEVHKGSSEWDIIDIMLKEFNTIYDDQFQERTQELDMSVHEVVTLASIVEREAMVDKERTLIAGVFHNRLKTNMLLQSCATVYYITGRETVSTSDTLIENPYNTYRYQGLPPGPVGAPGQKSIESTLYYQETDYYYFVTKKDGTGEHYFSKTYEQHKKYDKKSRNN